MGGGNVQTALIDLGSSLSVTTPSIAKLSGAPLVSGFNPFTLSLQSMTLSAIYYLQLSRVVRLFKATIAGVEDNKTVREQPLKSFRFGAY